ncbi:hypothetical protein ADL26_20745, partial [Thermoactinomyces vulgaris]
MEEFAEVVAIHSCGELMSLAKAWRWAVVQDQAPEAQASESATTWSMVALETEVVQVLSKSDCQLPEVGWQPSLVTTFWPSRLRTYWRAVQPPPT